MATGTIKFYVSEKGFGFISPDDGGPDLFFHISRFNPRGSVPAQGQRVEFDTEVDKKRGKVNAVDVEVVS